jgi:hypothetical protein
VQGNIDNCTMQYLPEQVAREWALLTLAACKELDTKPRANITRAGCVRLL